MKIRLMVALVGMMLGAWLVASYLSPATPSGGDGSLMADAHRLGPMVAEGAALPEGEMDLARTNLFVLLTKADGESITTR